MSFPSVPSWPGRNTEAELSDESFTNPDTDNLFSILCFRDLAAAVDRKEKYNFDEMIYVVRTFNLTCMTHINRQHRSHASDRHCGRKEFKPPSSQKCASLILILLILNFKPAMCFKQVGTWTTKGWGSCGMSKPAVLRLATGKRVIVLWSSVKGASSEGSEVSSLQPIMGKDSKNLKNNGQG